MSRDEKAELARLRAENEALEAKLAQSEAAQEILKEALTRLEEIRPDDAAAPHRNHSG